MNILLLAVLLPACLADKPSSSHGHSFFRLPSHSGESSEETFIRRPVFSPRPPLRPVSAPRQAPRSTFPAPRLSPQSPFAPRPAAQSSFSAPRPAAQSSFSAPRPAPRPSASPRSSPQPSYSAPQPSYQPSGPVVPILVDERVHPDGGAYSFLIETGDGLKWQETGRPIPGEEGPVSAASGSYSFTLPDGQVFQLSYVADENGFQPESPFLPVAPEFPHPIPAHALEQIERGRLEHEARARGELRQAPARGYGAPPQ
ncbi:endocuticle structural glycoprotein SgAbd-1 [Procambarus clarkii]|uniref:endocuticle structural glycoprotein SgAbd-1 n=1 Tax=Procambarus clarkii TaxID=6728 RepID=UPI001E6725B0|nr:endocuticle structural glycoprotein SgAbd-1-like [Procambarus clarkii]